MLDSPPATDVRRELRLIVRRMRRQEPPVTWVRIAAELGVSVTTAKSYAAAPPRPGRHGNREVTVRRRLYAKGLIEGKNKIQAAQDAGCPTPSSARHFAQKAAASPEFQD
jgi:hypothetical protein